MFSQGAWEYTPVERKAPDFRPPVGTTECAGSGGRGLERASPLRSPARGRRLRQGVRLGLTRPDPGGSGEFKKLRSFRRALKQQQQKIKRKLIGRISLPPWPKACVNLCRHVCVFLWSGRRRTTRCNGTSRRHISGPAAHGRGVGGPITNTKTKPVQDLIHPGPRPGEFCNRCAL